MARRARSPRAAQVQAPGDGRQIFQADADMARLFLEDRTALILSQSPPRLPNEVRLIPAKYVKPFLKRFSRAKRPPRKEALRSGTGLGSDQRRRCAPEYPLTMHKNDA